MPLTARELQYSLDTCRADLVSVAEVAEALRAALEAETARAGRMRDERDIAREQFETVRVDKGWTASEQAAEIMRLRGLLSDAAVLRAKSNTDLATLRAEQERLTREVASANARFCDQHRGIWKSSGCVACGVINLGEAQHQLRAEREALAARLRWQPMETAPKDGSWVLGRFADERPPASVSWHKATFGGSGWTMRDPIGWLPLPPAPTGEDGPR